MKCPRTGCGSDITITRGGLIETHKLPDEWRTCAASGKTIADAEQMKEPVKINLIVINR